MKKSEQLIFIDYLKSFSMLYIVGYWHLFDYTEFLPEDIYLVSKKFSLITLGLFTFISGFLNGRSIIKSPKVADFYVKRLIRIYPLYLFAIVLFLLYGLKDGLTALKSLFLVSMLHGPAPRTLWFIAMIMLFYLIAPFLVKLAGNLRKYIIFASLIMLLTTIVMIAFRTIDIRLVMYFPCFCLGIYCALNGVENRILNVRNTAILLTLGLLPYTVQTDWWTLEKLEQIPFILSASYLIFLVSYRHRNTFVNTGFILFLSYSSYAMYLFHRPIYETLKTFYFPEAGFHQLLYLASFCLLVIALVSWVFQWLNDKLYMATSNWLRQLQLSRHR